MEKFVSLSRKNFDFNLGKYKKKLFIKSNVCECCGRKEQLISYFILDHLIPVKISPTNIWNTENLWLICKRCDSKKLSIDFRIIRKMVKENYFSKGSNWHTLYISEKECINYYINKVKEIVEKQ